jgi:uncharacterized protein (TIGR02118 family)
MIKVMVMVKRKPGISREEFYKYWKEVHGPLMARHIPGLRKYVQNHYIAYRDTNTKAMVSSRPGMMT